MISGKKVKRINIKRRDNEVEGDDSRSDVTLSANENDCVDDSDVGLMEDANTLKQNTNVVPLVVVFDHEGTFRDHANDADTGNYS